MMSCVVLDCKYLMALLILVPLNLLSVVLGVAIHVGRLGLCHVEIRVYDYMV